MASKLGIWNDAGIKLGRQQVVMDENENTPFANLCKEQYDKSREELLREHSWNFSTHRAKLAQLTDVPAFEFDHAYQLPTDWFRTISVHDNDAGDGAVEYRTEGRTLASNADELYLRYVRDIADVGIMDPSFRRALGWQLALDVALAFTQSNSVFDRMAAGLGEAISTAKSIDAIEDFPEREPESSWITVRCR